MNPWNCLIGKRYVSRIFFESMQQPDGMWFDFYEEMQEKVLDILLKGAGL
jgi:hypothetical protein